jgi:glucose/arabinose dehydrogenase
MVRFVVRRLPALVLSSLPYPLSVLLLFIAATAHPATLPAGFTETRVAAGLASPTAMAFAPDGRLFVAEQSGRLRVIKNGTLLATPFITLSVNASGERGLLGVAFDPQFASNGFIYVYYTTSTSPVHNRISRFTANSSNPDVVANGTEVQLLNLPNLSSATNHNGGAIHFGTDGKLYLAVGENAAPSNAPSLSTTLGKVLRINSDGTIPSDNPFISQTSGINQTIWARGLRNPFNFAIDRTNGRIHVNDVGQDSWEEVNHGIAGANFGWPATEGLNPPSQAGVAYPIHTYQNAGTNCAITGAAFYRPVTTNFPSEYVGRYFFGDFCGGFIRTLGPPDYTQSSGFATGIGSLVDIQTAADGTLYYLARSNGEVFRVAYTANSAPAISSQPASIGVGVGQSATFRVSASGVGPLRYQWQRNGVSITNATAATYTIGSVVASDNGATFRAIISNDFGTATSNPATLSVTGGSAPSASITSPTAGTLYRGAQVFTYSGTASDAEDGALPASAYTWRVDFHHDTHSHPFVPATSGVTSGNFTIPDRGETSANVFYRITLAVRDSSGLTTTRTLDLQPRTSVVRIESSPSNLQLTLDGTPITTPHTFTGVEGIVRALGAPPTVGSGGNTYDFVSWSDGGQATHEMATPTEDTTFTALYQPAAATAVFNDNFENNRGWTLVSGQNTATTGRWQRGDPQPTSIGGVPLQLGSCGGGSTNCLITGLTSGSYAGANDLDAGLTSIQSPAITLPTGSITINFRYYFSHSGSTAADFFRVRILGGSGALQTVFQETSSASNDAAAWISRSVNLSGYAGQTIRIRFEANDVAGASYVEAGVDDVVVTRQ